MPRRADPAAAVQPWLSERLRAPRRTVRSGRRTRTARRILAAALLILAGITATWPRPQSAGIGVVTVTRDLPPGHLLTMADLTTDTTPQAPDGAVGSAAVATGRTLAGATRRGEILTDVRLVPADGPDPGPGRRALTVRPLDADSVALLSPGMHISVVGLDSDGTASVLTGDAVVLAVPESAGNAGSLRPILVAVPTGDADRVSAATLAGDVAVQFT